jgi:UDP-glucose 4-epimerase
MVESKTILITGVGGLLGSRLADYIIENHPSCKVVGVDDLSGGYRENINEKVNFWQMDLANHPIENIFEAHKPDIVFHFAAYAAEGLSPFIRAYNYDNNLKATAKIVNECIKWDVDRLVFTSTMAVYGHGWEGKRPFEESDPPAPIDPYGIAKFACEMDIQAAGEQHGLDWTIIRPHNVYGIKQNIWDKYRNVLGIWMYQYMNNEPLTIFGDGEQKRAWSYIDDCLEPLWKAAFLKESSKEIINLGGSKFTTINEACTLLREVMGGGDVSRIPVVFKEARHEVKDAYPTHKKSEVILDYKDKTELKDGLTKMWKWAQEQPMRERFVWDEYELEKGLYSFWKVPPKDKEKIDLPKVKAIK